MPGEWFRAAFREDYRMVYAHRDAQAARAEVGAVIQMLEVRPSVRILDCGSGWGRHLTELRQAGFDAVGVDLSAALLADTRMSGLPVVRGDWRWLPFGTRFDAVLSLFTSFGYGPTDADDARALREIARVTVPGGRVLLDLPNPAQVRAGLVPASETTLATGDGGSVRISERRRIVNDGRRVEKDVMVHRDPAVIWTESVRLYEADELRTLFAATGVRLDAIHGGFGGEPWGADAPRCILVGTRR